MVQSTKILTILVAVGQLVEHWWFDVEVLLDKTSSGTNTHVQLSINSFSKGTNKIIKKI